MGKTNLTLLIIGLAGCLALSLIMQRMVKLGGPPGSARVSNEINKSFGHRMLDQAKFVIEKSKKKKGARTGVLTFQPQIPSAGPKMAKDMGAFIWSMGLKKFDKLVMVVKRHGGDQGRRIAIPRPYRRATAPGKPPAAPR